MHRSGPDYGSHFQELDSSDVRFGSLADIERDLGYLLYPESGHPAPIEIITAGGSKPTQERASSSSVSKAGSVPVSEGVTT